MQVPTAKTVSFLVLLLFTTIIAVSNAALPRELDVPITPKEVEADALEVLKRAPGSNPDTWKSMIISTPTGLWKRVLISNPNAKRILNIVFKNITGTIMAGVRLTWNVAYKLRGDPPDQFTIEEVNCTGNGGTNNFVVESWKAIEEWSNGFDIEILAKFTHKDGHGTLAWVWNWTETFFTDGLPPELDDLKEKGKLLFTYGNGTPTVIDPKYYNVYYTPQTLPVRLPVEYPPEDEEDWG